MTFVITAVMEALSRTSERPWSKFLRAAGGAIALTVTYTVAMHWFMGTPEILATVLPVLSLGSLYCVLYSANLVREAKRPIGG